MPPPARAKSRRKPKSIQAIAIAAFARNGLNTLLLDIKEDLTFALCEIEAIHNRLNAVHNRLDSMEPKLATLDNERRERIGVTNFLTSGRVWLVTLGTGAVGAAWHFFNSKP